MTLVKGVGVLFVSQHGVLVNTPHEGQADTMTENPRTVPGPNHDDVQGHGFSSNAIKTVDVGADTEGHIPDRWNAEAEKPEGDGDDTPSTLPALGRCAWNDAWHQGVPRGLAA